MWGRLGSPRADEAFVRHESSNWDAMWLMIVPRHPRGMHVRAVLSFEITSEERGRDKRKVWHAHPVGVITPLGRRAR